MADSIQPANPALTPPAPRDPRIWQAAQDFEAVLIGQLTKHMFDTKSVGDTSFSGGFAEETWSSMLADQMGKEITKRGGVGLADSVYAEMIRMQTEGRRGEKQ